MRKRDTLRRLIKRLSLIERNLKRAGKGAQAFQFKVKADAIRQILA